MSDQRQNWRNDRTDSRNSIKLHMFVPSVYLEFEDVSEFMTELKHLVRTRKRQSGASSRRTSMIKPVRATGLGG